MIFGRRSAHIDVLDLRIALSMRRTESHQAASTLTGAFPFEKRPMVWVCDFHTEQFDLRITDDIRTSASERAE